MMLREVSLWFLVILGTLIAACARPAVYPVLWGEREHPPRWTMDGKGIGSIRIHQSLPKQLLTDDLASHYVSGYVADAQAFDGFHLSSPDMLIMLNKGPFQRRAAMEPGLAPSHEPYREQAIRMARRGAKVKTIVTYDPSVRTASGLGVGVDLAALRAVHPDLTVHPVPPTLGEDACVAYSSSEPTIHYLFVSCQAAHEGHHVARVDIWD